MGLLGFVWRSNHWWTRPLGLGGGDLFAKFSFSGIFWCYGHHRWGINLSKGSIGKFRSPSGHITFDLPHCKVIFKSVHHPSLWGVYPEVLMALAQNSWENSISLNRLGEKSQKPHFETGIFKTEIKYGFWDFSPKRFDKNEISQLFWASAINTSG